MRYSHSAGGIVVHKKTRKVVIVSQFGVSWSFPKGGIEESETELEAATREIFEETGIKDLKLIKPLGSYERYQIKKSSGEVDLEHIKKLTFFLFESEADQLKPKDSDNPVALWVDKKKMIELLSHPKDKEFFASIMDQI